MMWWSGGDWAWWMGIPMTLAMVAFWGLVIWAVVSLIRPGGTGSPPSGGAPPDPEERLAARLADGTIDISEYEARLDALRRGRTRTTAR